ncbi:MAG: hypothetical protein P8Y42_11725 [Exilibacterium sp.]
MSGFLHLILPRSRFSLVEGEDFISTYTFNTGVAQHTFCKVCGIKPFYTPRSNPDGICINVRCIIVGGVIRTHHGMRAALLDRCPERGQVGFLAPAPARIAKDIDVGRPDAQAAKPVGATEPVFVLFVFGPKFRADDAGHLRTSA